MNKFFKEISEQPQALLNTFEYYINDKGADTLEAIRNLWESGQWKKILFTGMVSSFFISQAAATLLTSNGIPAFVVNTGELLHSQYPILDTKTLLVCISQSGESYEIVQLLHKKISSTTVIGITNEHNSTLAKQATHTLLCQAGTEEMTSTKTFTATYLVTYLLSLYLTRKQIDQTVGRILAEEVERLITSSARYLIPSLTLLGESPFVQLIGRGTDYASAAQSALMLMEATKTPASALLGGEFRHGPFEMVDKKFIGILFAHSQSATYQQSIKQSKEILDFGGKVILMTDIPSRIENSDFLEVQIRCMQSELFVIPAIIPIQLMVNAWAEEKGLIPGNFTHGAKVTLIE